MRTLALHIECLRQVERSSRRMSTTQALGFIAGTTLVGLTIFGCHCLEQLVLERLGAP